MEERSVEPVIRCTDCQRLVFCEEIKKHGCCPGCGNRRFKNVQILSMKERAGLEERGVDAEFLNLFEAVDNG